MNGDLNSSMFTDGNKSPEVDEVEAEDSDTKKVPEVKEQVEDETSTEFGTLSMQEKIICKYLSKCF